MQRNAIFWCTRRNLIKLLTVIRNHPFSKFQAQMAAENGIDSTGEVHDSCTIADIDVNRAITSSKIDYEDNSSEYEEVLIYVDFPDFDNCPLINPESTINFKNITSATPSCDIGNLHFVGEHQINLGTQLFVDTTMQRATNLSETVTIPAISKNVIEYKLRSIDKPESDLS